VRRRKFSDEFVHDGFAHLNNLGSPSMFPLFTMVNRA
jgi:hypothetical protein